MAMMLELMDEYHRFYQDYQEGNFDLRLNFHPPCPQPNKVPGLRVLKDGQWVYVEQIDGAIVIMSNGIYKVPEYRAVVNKLKERVFVVTLCYPNSSLTVGPAKQLTQTGNLDVSFIELLQSAS
ncbi:protein SRG1-like [Mercurialis annua]|uniref:protein SRG1-like n=1 Tax=Mercurialis annua TaxID=3986 RepID=UPI00215DFE48|nr:protein SRG1-like [Mercurialis annua]